MLSILLSLIVDLLDKWDRGGVEEDLLDRKWELGFILVPSGWEINGDFGNELEFRKEEESPQLPLF